MIKLLLIVGFLLSLTTLAMGKSPYTPNNQLTMPPNLLEAIDTVTLKQEFKELGRRLVELGDKLCNSRDKRSSQYARDYYEFEVTIKRRSKVWKELLLRNSKS